MARKLIFLLVLLLAAGAAGYFWWYAPGTEAPQVPGEMELRKIADGPVVSPVNSYDNDAIWYGLGNGRMMWYNLNTAAQTEYPLPQVPGGTFRKIFWPRQGNDFIALSSVDGQPQFSYFNYADKKYFILPRNVAALDWMANGAKIAVIWKSGDGKTYLVTSNPDASGYKILRELPWSDMTIKASPTGETALLMRTSAAETNKIYLFDLETGDYSDEVEDGRNTSVTWSPNGDRFAFTRLVDGESRIFVHDLLNGQDTDLELSAGTDKAAFSADGDKFYAAAMSEDGRTEELWKIDLVTQDREVVFSSETLRMESLIAIGQKVYFMDQNDALHGYE
jgi:WD40 repeat protein